MIGADADEAGRYNRNRISDYARRNRLGVEHAVRYQDLADDQEQHEDDDAACRLHEAARFLLLELGDFLAELALLLAHSLCHFPLLKASRRRNEAKPALDANELRK